MNVLIVASDAILASIIKSHLKDLLADDTPVVLSKDLSESIGQIEQTDGGVKFDLIICCETVDDIAEGRRPGNGVEAMKGIPDIPIIILSDNEPSVPVPDNMYRIHRGNDLQNALRHFFPYLM